MPQDKQQLPPEIEKLVRELNGGGRFGRQAALALSRAYAEPTAAEAAWVIQAYEERAEGSIEADMQLALRDFLARRAALPQ